MAAWIKSTKNEIATLLTKLGKYYQTDEINYDLMKKYYLMAIDFECPYAMNNLGAYYHSIKKYDLAKTYYLMACELGCIDAMNNLGVYYQYIEVNEELMKKYLLMAINLNNCMAMLNFAEYYQHVEKNTELMKKYYDMAIQLKNVSAMKNLGLYYYESKDMQSAILYLNMAFKQDNRDFTILEILVKLMSKRELKKIIQEYPRNKLYLLPYLDTIANECGICLNNCNLIMMPNCEHRTCIKCHIKLEICPYCRA